MNEVEGSRDELKMSSSTECNEGGNPERNGDVVGAYRPQINSKKLYFILSVRRTFYGVSIDGYLKSLCGE